MTLETINSPSSEMTPMPLNEEATRPDGGRQGNEIDFEIVYSKYHRRVLQWCLRVVRNTEDAEDLAQDAFIQVMKKAHTFRGEAHFLTWLFRVVMNTVFMKLRRKRVSQLNRRTTSKQHFLSGGTVLIRGNCLVMTAHQSK